MSEYKASRIGYMDKNGNFNEIGYVTNISIDANDLGRVTVTVDTYDNSYLSNTVSSLYTKKYMDKYVENMFDKIKDYKVYGKTTVVFFNDGTKSTVVCCDEDNFDVEEGIAMCVIKRMFGDDYKKKVRNIIKAKTLNEKNLRKLEGANKEAQIREEKRERRKRENAIRMKARYEARLTLAIEEEKERLKEFNSNK